MCLEGGLLQILKSGTTNSIDYTKCVICYVMGRGIAVFFKGGRVQRHAVLCLANPPRGGGGGGGSAM